MKLRMSDETARSNFNAESAKRSVAITREATASPGPGDERRAHARYLTTRPLVVIPLLPDHQPMRVFQAEGVTIDLSQSGVGFEISGIDRLPSSRLVVGIEGEDEQLYFATLEVRRVDRSNGRLVVGGNFTDPEEDVLRPHNVLPHLNPHSHRFETGLPTLTLYKWAELGVCRPVLIDRILVCPDCNAIPTIRRGCRACGSVRTATSQLIHHFPCAHVGLVSEFEIDGGMCCPKCRQRRLVIGADYEYLTGPYRCLDCNWADTQMEFVGQCLVCDLRFPIQQAIEEELIGYYVHRLDPMGLVSKN